MLKGEVQNTSHNPLQSRWLDRMLQDLRYALRVLAKSPAFTCITVLTLGLGIGANAALFSVVKGVLLNPLPFPDAGNLVALHESKPNFESGSISYVNFRDWQKDNHTFEAMAVARPSAYIMTGLGASEQILSEFVSEDFFPLLGVHPLIGRTFTRADEEVGAAPVVLISEGLWRRKFGASQEVLGKTITLDKRNYTIVGVIAAGFHLRIPAFRERDIYVPFGQWNNPLFLKRGAGLGVHGIGRLKQGVSVQQARADLATVTRNLGLAYPDTNQGVGAKVVPLKQTMVGGVQPILLTLFGAALCVLLIACVNVTNLSLARSSARAREFAVRAALGASRLRVLQQVLTESVLLGLAGGCLGAIIAAWATQAALTSMPLELPRSEEIRFDPQVLIFTAVISLVAGILFGLTPALKTSGIRVQVALKEAAPGLIGARYRAQRVFVVVEMALALVLLTSAGLMVRSLIRLWNVDPGFNPHNVLTYALTLPPSLASEGPQKMRAAIREYDDRVRSIPGISAASQTWGAIPMGGDDEQLFWIEGQPKPASDKDMSWAIDYIVEPDYLNVMGLRLLQGRFLREQDDESSRRVVVIDDVFKAKHFPGENPIGKHIFLNTDGTTAEIVGVVAHVKQWGLDTDDSQSVRAQLYLAGMQMPDSFLSMSPGGNVIVRAKNVSPDLFASIRESSQKKSEEVVFGAQTMHELIAQSVAERTFSMYLLAVFAALSLLLASVGIYGVISYVVGQRTREIGIRIAIGAQPLDVLWLVLGQAARMAGVGVALGFVIALGLTRLLSSLLFSVRATDPLTFVATALLLSLIALLGCYVPARRASRTDPMLALRYE